MTLKKIVNDVNSYYSNRIEEMGATPAGVDWNSVESQHLRFEQLLKVIDVNLFFKILDYGCGYGALFELLKGGYKNFDYTGYDISDKMINAAVGRNNFKNAKWVSSLPKVKFDYVVASGLFNVKLTHSNKSWFNYIIKTIADLDKYSTKGFAFNVLTKYSDADKMKDYLYYADPLVLFDYCKKNFSRNVALLHDYKLYEFTIIVRK